jgi:hypothetical protein
MRERITIPVEGIINEWRKNNKEQDYKDWHNEERQMGSQSEDGFHPSSRRIIYQECEHDRENPGLEEGLTQGARLRHADAYVLYKPRWTRAQCQAPGTTRKGEVLTLEKDLRANESSSPKLKLNGFVRQRRKSRYRVKALLPLRKGDSDFVSGDSLTHPTQFGASACDTYYYFRCCCSARAGRSHRTTRIKQTRPVPVPKRPFRAA